MRTIIFIATVSSFYLFACNGDNSRKDYPTIGEDEVMKMSAKYKELVKDPKLVIQHIVMDQKELRKFTQGSERVKLIAAGYEVPVGDIKTTIIIQIMTRKDNKPVYTYYDFRKVFKTKPRKDADSDDNTICPPPDDCGIPVLNK